MSLKNEPSKAKFIRMFFFMMGFMPLWFIRPLGLVLGSVVACFKPRSYRIVNVNLQLCLPELSDKERTKMVRLRLRRMAQSALEMAKTWGIRSNKALNLIQQVEGLELLEEAIEEGKGVILLAPHIGNWEIIGLYLALSNHDVTYLYQPPKDPVMDNFIVAARTRMGGKLVPTTRSGVTRLLKALRSGQVIAILPDQVPTDEGGIYAPFFGNQALTMTLISTLALKTGAKVICSRAIACRKGYQITFSRPAAEIYSIDIEESVAGVNKTVEVCARENLEYYQWEYKRFKRPPDNLPSPYSVRPSNK